MLHPANLRQPLQNQRPDVEVRTMAKGAQTPMNTYRRFFTPVFLCYGGCVRGTSVRRVPLAPVFHTCAQLPPSCGSEIGSS
jgi:hypothetical protein